MSDRPRKPGQQAPGDRSSGNRNQDEQSAAREARLAAALRANLRRRKAAGRQTGAGDVPGDTAATEAPGTAQEENDS